MATSRRSDGHRRPAPRSNWSGGELASAPALRPGQRIHSGKYVIRGVLGRAGAAVLYDAEHVILHRSVAIKVLHVRPTSRASFVPRAVIDRFQDEIRASALVRHPNVLETYDSGLLSDRSPFMVVERIDGIALSAMLARGPLSVELAMDIGCQLASALSAIADAGIVHRDIKPENIMLHTKPSGATIVKLSDFGVAKRLPPSARFAVTAPGELVGTPRYMSPEQLSGAEVDMRSDVYSIGAVLYETLTGRPPHVRANLGDLVQAVLHEPVLPPSTLCDDCPDDLDQVLNRALSRDPAKRYASAHELQQALSSCIEAARERAVLWPQPALEVAEPSAEAVPAASLDERKLYARKRRLLRFVLARVLPGLALASVLVVVAMIMSARARLYGVRSSAESAPTESAAVESAHTGRAQRATVSR